ncbi:glycosyltransferase family 2 protein [Desulfobacter latus]|uniref:Glycosyltransferase family 2 protein n=1 Tax=Desulfobacter latus TaxID=2292 RepID=A0A850T929_9BACT|nr:glycosyltransferase family 2 protein [Desulfobacter latus]NWH04707.1 glycosyltransferase family 2 protein [Desulfobacter latus]
MFNVTLIIPTYNRPKLLNDCIESILIQTRLPDELIVVDDGDLDEIPLESQCTQAGIALRYIKKDVPGLTESRNAGVRIATGDIIFFLDDDVILDREYIDQIMVVYENAPDDRIGGVGGAITNIKPMHLHRRLRRWVERFFIISGFQEGRVLPSGYFTDFTASIPGGETLKDVDFLSGGVMSFKRQIFEQFRFTDRYRAYGLGEDKDFTFQVAQQYRLVFNKKATLVHLEAIEMRPDKRLWGKKFVLGRYLFFRDHVLKNPWQWILFAYATTGYLIIRTMIFYVSWRKENAEHVLGILDGIYDIIRQRVLIRR